MEEEIFIYALKCPIDNKIKYIGQTKIPKTRLWQHIYKSETRKDEKSLWINKLKKMDKKTEMLILEVTTKDKADSLEDLYIIKYSKQYKLFNKVLNKNMKPKIENKETNKINKKKRYYLPDEKITILNLTNKETTIIKLVCSGYDHKDICKELYICNNTLKIHLSSIRTKMGLDGISKTKNWVIRALLILLDKNIAQVVNGNLIF